MEMDMNSELSKMLDELKKFWEIAGENYKLMAQSKDKLIRELSELKGYKEAIEEYHAMLEANYRAMVDAGKAIDRFEQKWQGVLMHSSGN